jgi:hypothetical protein
MSQEQSKRIGLIIGREWDWPSAFMTAVNESDENITAELIKLGGTRMGETCDYDLIIDRMSHEVPYYRSYLSYAAVRGADIINNPFTWAVDSRFMGHVVINKLGLPSPRTIALPNKDVEREVVPDSFRNLKYPMDWQGIIDYVGVPAILKDIRVGGRRIVYRVNSVDDLIQRYDESGTRTMILQEIIEADTHIHCFVIGQEKVLTLRYSLEKRRYLPTPTTDKQFDKYFMETALLLTRCYGYDINMVEFVLREGHPYVINSTNPVPVMDKQLMMPDQFSWCVDEMVNLAIERAKRPLPTSLPFQFDIGT